MRRTLEEMPPLTEMGGEFYLCIFQQFQYCIPRRQRRDLNLDSCVNYIIPSYSMLDTYLLFHVGPLNMWNMNIFLELFESFPEPSQI